MQVADRRMMASVGSMIFGSSRCSRRTSPGAWRTAPLILALPFLYGSAGMTQQGAWNGGHGGDSGGDEQAGAQAVEERPVGDERTEDRDGERAADLAAGVEHPAGGA